MRLASTLSFICFYLFSHTLSPKTWAAAFETCPSYAYLIQTPSSSPIVYGIDLSTGSYSILSFSMGTTSVNGAGFNVFDNYIYGWDYGSQTLSQIGDDYQVYPLNVTGLIGKTFYVGDVATDENAWYGYRRGKGLYRINLATPLSPLTLEQVATSTAMGNPSLTDMAFHPENGILYAVDNNGILLEIDVSTGSTVELTQVLSESTEGYNFAFGAQYFDAAGNLYISNNGNGYIFKVTLDGSNSSAMFFAYGPSSNFNDGARCALAPISISSPVDFGDAPDTYGTEMDSSGARHAITALFLGDTVDAESDAYTYPLSDDVSDSANDDDGITFITGLEIGESAIINVEFSGDEGYLNAWIDWDRDGIFQDDEKAIDGEELWDDTTLSIDVPTWALAGSTWSRFRLSSYPDISATGGVNNGEVEDYPVTITESSVGQIYYPSSTTFTTIAYEDQFPIQGDFDMNDVLMNLRFTEHVKDGKVLQLKIEGQLAALGADYQNGFGIRLENVARSNIKQDSAILIVDGVTQAQAFLEEGQTDAVIIINKDLWQIAQAGEGEHCNYFRTELGCGTSSMPSWSLIIPFNAAIAEADMPDFPYDPFIFATERTFHGIIFDAITGTKPGRKLEVHLKNKPHTDTFETSIFSLGDDSSNIMSSLYFQSDNGLPWAIEIPSDWKHPIEGANLIDAYPQFPGYAADSTQSTHPNWYLESNAESSLLYTD